MEIALNVPVADWYQNTPDNDLSYWGLDYPPLSGYASWLLGLVVRSIEPEALLLHSSRGFESKKSRAAMRITVLLGDLFIFFPALLLVCTQLYQKRSRSESKLFGSELGDWIVAFAFCISLPALVLIDHGHFQYNNISLGLFFLSVGCFSKERDMWGAVMFSAAIYFKHMTLYTALAVLSFLLGRLKNILQKYGLVRATCFAAKVLLAIIVLSAFVFQPWLHNLDLMVGLFWRLFPISRGLYEDKVANVWCSISTFIKIDRLMAADFLFKFCALVTVLASLPFCVAVAKKPSLTHLLLACSGCSLSAFLFSYQVHEKQILIPLLPLGVLYGYYPHLSVWMSITATFSLFPLLVRERLISAYIATLLIHAIIVSITLRAGAIGQRKVLRHLALGAGGVGAILNAVLLFGRAPKWAPDIFVLLNTGYACANFCLIYLALLVKTWQTGS